MEKMKQIKEILKNKGVLLVRTDESGKWFVHCWVFDGTIRRQVQGNVVISSKGRSIFKQYVDDVEKALDDVLKMLDDRHGT